LWSDALYEDDGVMVGRWGRGGAGVLWIVGCGVMVRTS